MNGQGAELPTDTPGNLIHTFTTRRLTLSTPSAMILLEWCPIQGFSLTEHAVLTLTPLAQLINRGQTEVKLAVPEPSTWAMMLLGFAGLGYAGFRKARSARSIA
jgi:hypothetical protein